MSVSRHVTVGAVHAVAMPERVMGVDKLYQKNIKLYWHAVTEGVHACMVWTGTGSLHVELIISVLLKLHPDKVRLPDYYNVIFVFRFLKYFYFILFFFIKLIYIYFFEYFQIISIR